MSGEFDPGARLPEVALAERLGISRTPLRQAMDRLVSELAMLMAGAVPHMSAAAIERELLEREALQTTAMGHGLAIPHATVPGLSRTFLGVMTLAQPIQYGENEDGEVDVCFCLLGPPSDRASHLRLLAAIASAVMGSDLLGRVRNAETQEQLLEALDPDASKRLDAVGE